MSHFRWRDIPTLGVGGLTNDNMESYADAVLLSTLNGGTKWAGAWVDRTSPTGVTDYENFESYADAAAVNGLNGRAAGFPSAWVDRVSPYGVKDNDNMETYADAAVVSGLNGGTVGWSGAWTAADSLLGVRADDAMDSYSDGVDPHGLDSGTGWTGAYVSRPSDLNEWITRVQGQGSDVTGSGIQAAVTTFINGLKTDGLWTLAYRIGVYNGDGLNALKAPLKNTLGNTTDNLVAFVSGDYSSTGLVGGGAGRNIRTGVLASMFSVDSFSMGIYTRTPTGSGVVQMGCQTSGDATRGCYLYHDASNAIGSMWNTGTQISASDAGGVGFYLLSRVSSSDARLYKNGSQIGSTNTSPGSNTNAFDIWIHDGNLSGAGSWAPSSQSVAFYWLGQGLNSTQSANLYTRVQTLQTAFSRQV